LDFEKKLALPKSSRGLMGNETLRMWEILQYKDFLEEDDLIRHRTWFQASGDW